MPNSKLKITALVLSGVLLVVASFAITNAYASSSVAARVKGKIVLQVEKNGEAWYINPADSKRYYLGTPDLAFGIMKNSGIGITDSNLFKIPVGLVSDSNTDTDKDGLNDDLEKALGTNPKKSDTDGDGYNDKTELQKNYNPKGAGSLKYDTSFTKTNAGKIFLQTENKGQAWYVNPADQRRYFLNRPSDAFSIMRKLGLGITTADLEKIVAGAGTGTASKAGLTADSPFALYGLFLPYTQEMCTGNLMSKNDTIAELKNLNVKWVEEYEGKENNLSLIPSDVNIFSMVGKEAGFKTPNAPTDAYKTALREKIRNNKDRIKIWKIDDEPSERTPTTGTWGDSTDYDKYSGKYADFLQTSYTIIKDECPDCQVSVGGFAGVSTRDVSEQTKTFLKGMLAYSKEKYGRAAYFDIFEFKQHFYNASDYQELKKKKDTYKKIFSDVGVDLDSMPIFLETATHDANPQKNPYVLWLKNQSESTQAAGLIKIHIYSVSIGIDRIFWDNLLEVCYKNNMDDPFNYFGLINNPLNKDGLSHKKLAYYSYKKMVEVLDGSDWNNIQTVQASDGVYVYKFTKSGKSIWVAWNDNADSKTINLNVGSLTSVKVMEAVPNYESGKEVTDYNTAFSTQTKTAQNKQVSLTLTDTPVFVGSFSASAQTTSSNSTSNTVSEKTSSTSNTPVTSVNLDNKLCGDGVCDSAETNNPNLCPGDCD